MEATPDTAFGILVCVAIAVVIVILGGGLLSFLRERWFLRRRRR
jgi:ABC-type bacteriocin/lantibiotic exporter with double-glycine peptidase domain